MEQEYVGASYTAYARLFLVSLLPKNINKVLYMDCDGLILGSFKKLWEMNLDDYYCAGVLDVSNENFIKLLGFNENYVNSGFLLINLEKWRKDNIETIIKNYISENSNNLYYHDQGIINNVFENKIKIIGSEYNLQQYYQFYDYNLSKKFKGLEKEYYTKEIVDDARKNPIVHFCGGIDFKPWYNKDHYYADKYKYYAKKANGEEIIQYKELQNFRVKLFYKGTKNK